MVMTSPPAMSCRIRTIWLKVVAAWYLPTLIAGLTVLHPETQDYAEKRKSNNLSCVLRIDAGGRRMLLTSDIEARDEAALLQRDAAALKADVLLVPHHGSRTSSTAIDSGIPRPMWSPATRRPAAACGGPTATARCAWRWTGRASP